MRSASGISRPVAELPWLRRRLALRRMRSMLRKAPVEGLRGLDRDGSPVWDDGYPEALRR